MRAYRWILLSLSVACSISAGCNAPIRDVGNDPGSGGEPDFSTGDLEPFPGGGVTSVSTGAFIPPGFWTKSYGDASDQRAAAFAVDTTGNIALTGSAFGTIDFGNVPWIGKDTDEDVFVAKLDIDGRSQWSRRYGDSCDQHGGAVALAPSGNVVIAGDFCGKMDFGDTAVTAPAGEVDLFIAAIDTVGVDIYSRRIGGAGPQIARAAAVDGGGNALVVGSFEKAFDDGSGAVASAGMDDVFVIKLNPAGKVVWSQTFGGPEADLVRSVAVDKVGNVILGGSFGGSVDFGGGPLSAPAGHSGGFLVKLDPQGNHLWSQSFGGDDDVLVTGVAVSPFGVVGATGSFRGTADLGGGPALSNGEEDIFLTTFEGDGSPLWARTFGGAMSQRTTGVTFGVNGEVGIAGSSSEAIDFDDRKIGPLASFGPEMIFFAGFDSTGVARWGRSLTTAAPMESVGIGVDGQFGSVLVGSFQKSFFGSTEQNQNTESVGGWDVFVSHQP